ncbi:MAG: HU family DNA-binding protein [Pelagibacteraceae bacterium]
MKEKNSRIGRNPKTKEEHIIEPRRVISFKKSKKLKL